MEEHSKSYNKCKIMSSALCRRRLLGFLMTMLFPEGMSGEGYAEVVAKQQPYTKLPNLAFYANYK